MDSDTKKGINTMLIAGVWTFIATLAFLGVFA